MWNKIFIGDFILFLTHTLLTEVDYNERRPIIGLNFKGRCFMSYFIDNLFIRRNMNQSRREISKKWFSIQTIQIIYIEQLMTLNRGKLQRWNPCSKVTLDVHRMGLLRTGVVRNIPNLQICRPCTPAPSTALTIKGIYAITYG